MFLEQIQNLSSTSQRAKSSLVSVAFFTVILFFVGVTLHRMWFGVDLTDESYYLALPYRFYLGQWPWVDEWNLTQTFSMLTYPFIKVYLLLNGSTEGLTLYSRLLYFTFQLCLSFSFFIFFSAHVPRSYALLLALIPLLYIHLGLPGLSYNTLGAGFFLMGLCFVMRREIEWREAACLGLFHGLATIAYPTFLVLVATVAAVLLWLAPKNISRVGSYLVSAGVTAIVILAIWHTTPEKVQDAYVFYKVFHLAVYGEPTGSLHRLSVAIENFWLLLPGKFLYLALVLCTLISMKRKMRKFSLFFSTALLMTVFYFSRRSQGGIAQSGLCMFFGIAAPIFSFAAYKQNRKEFLLGWLVAFVGMLTMSYTSSNSIQTGGPIATFAVALGFMFLFKKFGKDSSHTQVFLHGLAFLFLLMLAHFQRSAYLDGKLSELNTQVISGPFKGLYTSKAKADFVSKIENTLTHYDKKGRRVTFFPLLPGGYLMGQMAPGVGSVWDSKSPLNHDGHLRYFQKTDDNLVLELKYLFVDQDKTYVYDTQAPDPLADFYRSHYHVAETNDVVTVYQPASFH